MKLRMEGAEEEKKCETTTTKQHNVEHKKIEMLRVIVCCATGLTVGKLVLVKVRIVCLFPACGGVFDFI